MLEGYLDVLLVMGQQQATSLALLFTPAGATSTAPPASSALALVPPSAPDLALAPMTEALLEVLTHSEMLYRASPLVLHKVTLPIIP